MVDLETTTKYGQIIRSTGAIHYTPLLAAAASSSTNGGPVASSVAGSGSASVGGGGGGISSGTSANTASAGSAPKGWTIHEVLDKYLDDGSCDKPMLIADRQGSGQSTLLAHWVSTILDKSKVIIKHLPQYGACMTPALITLPSNPKLKRMILYVDLELILHYLDLPSILYYIMAMVTNTCTLTTTDLPDPNIDIIPLFRTWISTYRPDQIILLLDGLDFLPVKDEDPLVWLPLSINPNVRIIATAAPVGRMISACECVERSWVCIRRKSEMTVGEKLSVMDLYLKTQGIGLLKEWISPMLKSDKTSTHLQLATVLQVGGSGGGGRDSGRWAR